MSKKNIQYVKIIAQSEIYSVVEIVDEKDSEKRLKEIRKHYEALVLSNEVRNSDFEDKGLLVTTTLIKD